MGQGAGQEKGSGVSAELPFLDRFKPELEALVDTKVTCPNTRLKIIPEWFYRGHPLSAAYDSDSCSRSQSGRRKARFSVSGSLSAVSVAA